MSIIEETETIRVFDVLFPEKERVHLNLLDLNNIKILNRIFKDTTFYKSFTEWTDKDPKLTPYDVELLVATFLFEYSNQEMVNEFYKTFSQYTKNFDNQAYKFLMNIKQEIGKMLYKKLEPYAYEKNKDKYELKIDRMGMNFLFTFLDFRIYTIDKKYETSYFPRFKAFQSMFEEQTQFQLQNLKLTADLIILNIYYGESSKDMYTLGYNEFGDTPVENTPPVGSHMDSFILNHDENQSVLNFFVNYKLTEEEIENGIIRELNDLVYPNIRFLTDLEEFTGIGDGNVLRRVIYKIICRFQDKNHKINGKFVREYLKKDEPVIIEVCGSDLRPTESYKRTEPVITQNTEYSCYDFVTNLHAKREINKMKSVCPWCNKDNYAVQLTICNNDCDTVSCTCGKEYHIVNNECLHEHDPTCGHNEISDVDSVEEYRDAIFHDKNLDNMVSTLFKILEYDYSVKLEELIWKIKEFKTFEQLGTLDKYEIQFLLYTLKFSKILKNECNTLLSLIKDIVKEVTELHNFYVRKRIFRHEFNSDAIITHLNLHEDVKERIFKQFDEFSDTFSDVYKGTKSFLPYKYMFYRLLRNAGYFYAYGSSSKKFKEMETIYWCLQYPKDYDGFISFLNQGAHIVCENEYKVFDSPKKVVVSDFKHSLKEAYYLLTVKDELDLIIQYFTKFLPKINKRPEYTYNLFILEMEEEKLEITFESIFVYIIDELNEQITMIKEEIN